MKKIIAWVVLAGGILLFGLTIFLSSIQKIETGNMLFWIILSFIFIFSGLRNVWISINIKKQISVRRYFLFLLSLLIATSAYSYYLVPGIFLWFYIITILFFAFGITPLNASIRLKKWTNYVNSKITLNIISYADYVGIILVTIGLTWKSLHWPLADQLIIIGVLLLIIAAISWNKIFRIQIDLRIKAEGQVKEKNKEILDSINYAKRIQSAILPPAKLIKEHLKDSFILYKPKDIVAGDFYWLEPVGETVLFAAADCTGHGVPGAMVSVICNNGLNRSVREHGILDPGEILDKTREIVIGEFEKSEEEVKDGMDIALCKLEGTTLSYSGANNPLWVVPKGANSIEDVEVYKADKQPIGKYAAEKPFTTHTIELNSGDTIYLFSDGFTDQFGGEKGKKYKSFNFKRFLISIQNHSMKEQHNLLDEEFERWKGKLEQVDDVCVMGVKID